MLNIFSSFLFFSFHFCFGLTGVVLFVGYPAGAPAAVGCLAATGAALTAKSPSKNASASFSLLDFSKDPSRRSDD